ncbi:MAG: 50S ribosomal protein L4 [Bacteroidales bacterium]|nr:50S ribosomal protein L4 [Bacteroidales bacterium]
MELAVYNIEGKETGRTVVLNDELFGIEPNDHAIWLDVKQYLANVRQGTAKTKGRSEVALSTRKLKKQKGTGGARAGSLKSPVFVGGGTMFGPKPRNYYFKINKQVKLLARLSAIAYKAKENKIIIVEDFNLEAPKTSDFVKINNNLQISDKKSVFVLPERNINLYLSSRNLQRVSLATISDLNTYSIMNASVLVFFESSVNALQSNANS